MIIKFALQIIVFSSLGLVVYLVARAIPRVPEEVVAPRRANWVDRLMSKIPMAAIDEKINSFFAKFLRKFRVVVMRTDNFINDRLGKLNKKVPPSEPKDPSQDEHKSVL